MRIAIVAGPYLPVPPKQYGGTESVIYYLIRGLQAAGHEPILIGAGDSSVDRAPRPAGGVILRGRDGNVGGRNGVGRASRPASG